MNGARWKMENSPVRKIYMKKMGYIPENFPQDLLIGKIFTKHYNIKNNFLYQYFRVA